MVIGAIALNPKGNTGARPMNVRSEHRARFLEWSQTSSQKDQIAVWFTRFINASPVSFRSL
jgi:hypothetical protein